jgi:hypothetical protein
MGQNHFIQPEPLEFEFETPFGEFGSEFDKFDSFETLESEAMVGGIPEKDYLRWVQFSLNMYFKKTGLRPPLVEDGKDTADFRNAVELFNAKAWGRSKNKQIDTKFQDALIMVNEANSGYLKWLRKQLDKLGFAGFTGAYAAHEKPTKAIEEFQRIYSGKYGFSLVMDGFVGAKTHLALLHAIKEIKRPDKPVETDWEAFLDTKLRQLGDYFDDLSTFYSDTVYACVRKKLLRKGVDDRVAVGIPRIGPHDPPSEDDFRSLRQILISDLKKGYARGKIEKFWARFQIHVDNARDALSAIAFRITGQDIYDPGWKAVARDIKDHSRRPNHVYSCAFFREIIEEV